MIEIGVDGSSTVGPRTGVGVATAGLLNALPGAMPDGWRLKVWVNSPRHPLPADPWTKDERVQVIHTQWPGKVLLTAWRHLGAPSIRRFAGPLSLFHSTGGYPIPGPRLRRVISVHDLYFLQRPADEDPWGGGYFRASYPRKLAEHDRVICFSVETAQEIEAIYSVRKDHITVISHGVDATRFHPNRLPGEQDKIAAWTHGEPYLLTVGTIGKRKNLDMLVKAWARLVAHSPKAPRLVIVGHRTGGPNLTELDDVIAASGHADRVTWTGYLADAEVAALYRHALAFVFPSIKEGFGLPILEAMSCGAPVVCAVQGAVAEVAGDAALRADTTSKESLHAALDRISDDDCLRTKLREDGLARAMNFTWDQAARRTVEVYRAALDR